MVIHNSGQFLPLKWLLMKDVFVFCLAQKQVVIITYFSFFYDTSTANDSTIFFRGRRLYHINVSYCYIRRDVWIYDSSQGLLYNICPRTVTKKNQGEKEVLWVPWRSESSKEVVINTLRILKMCLKFGIFATKNEFFKKEMNSISDKSTSQLSDFC